MVSHNALVCCCCCSFQKYGMLSAQQPHWHLPYACLHFVTPYSCSLLLLLLLLLLQLPRLRHAEDPA
jgi:hypothetical protein